MVPEKLTELVEYLSHWFNKFIDMFVQCKACFDGVSAELGEGETELA